MKQLVFTTDWENKLVDIIRKNKVYDDFPKFEDYHITAEDFYDYISEKQLILDRIDNRKHQFVVPGMLLILPIIILSVFYNNLYGLMGGVGIGLVLCGLYYLIANNIDNSKLKCLYNEAMEQYATAVLQY